MSALDVIAALGGLCGAVALFLQLQEIRSLRADRLTRLAADLEAWNSFSPQDRAAALADVAEYEAPRDEDRDAYAVLLDIQFTSELLAYRQPQAGAGAYAARFLEAVVSWRPRSEAALLQAAELALRGRRHG